jgi:hypothetical protein
MKNTVVWRLTAPALPAPGGGGETLVDAFARNNFQAGEPTAPNQSSLEGTDRTIE